MSIINDAITWAVDIANDNKHGYSQKVRWGDSYDCSSFVISAFDYAFNKADRANLSPKKLGATYTGNMRAVFQRSGFTVLPNLAQSQLKRGDVLLNDTTHTALYIGNGQIVHARSSEGTTDTRDNSGNEIRVQGYYNKPWNCVLRYELEEVEDVPNVPVNAENSAEKPVEHETVTVPVEMCTVKLPVLKMGMVNNAVKQWQLLLMANKISVGRDGADADFGENTYKATIQFQQRKGIAATGIVDEKTYEKIWSI